jgi:hypothetical protein
MRDFNAVLINLIYAASELGACDFKDDVNKIRGISC